MRSVRQQDARHLFKNNDHASVTVLDPALNEHMLGLGVGKDFGL
jgi:hypothetical protein